MPTITLSESALAVLRLRAKEIPMKVDECRLVAYRELVAAGIMMPDGEDSQFTDALPAFQGAEVTRSAINAPSNALPRFRTL
jgi:hypothetical protein